MTTDDYVARYTSLFPLGRDRALAVSADGRAIPIRALAGQLLQRCTGSRTIEQHCAVAWQAQVSGDPHAIAAAAEELLRTGLLTPVRRPPTPASVAATAPLDTVAITTADRPVILKRCLNALAEQVQDRTSPITLFVIDGSSSESAASTNRALVAALASYRVRARYVGRGTARRLHHGLAGGRSRLGPVKRLLTPGGIGSNRNLALVLAGGRRFLFIDDDVVCRVWQPSDSRPGLALGGHGNCEHWTFYPHRRAALADLRPADSSLLTAHGAVLGSTLSALAHAGGGPDASAACRHVLEAWRHADRYTVRVTCAGLAGDAARHCSHSLLFLSGPTRDLLASSASQCAVAFTSREVRRSAHALTVTHDTACATYCMGIDATTLVPPFMPHGRGEDAVFGAMLGMIDPHALFAHLPMGVIHRSPRPARYSRNAMHSATHTRLSDVFLFFAKQCGDSTVAATPHDRLARFGRCLCDLAALPPTTFLTRVTELLLWVRCGALTALEAQLASPLAPPHLRRVFEDYYDTFWKRACRPDYFVAREHRRGTVDERVRLVQRDVRAFGEGILAWPEICERAGHLGGSS